MSTMKMAATVYYGPDVNKYPSCGSVSSGEWVKVHWKEVSGTWCYIEYFIDNSNYNKRGYVRTSQVNVTESVATKELKELPRYVHNQLTPTTEVFYGPNPIDFQPCGSVSFGESVVYLGEKTEGGTNYAFIEYDITGTSQKKRGWIYANYLGTGQPVASLVEGEYPPDMNINGPYYNELNWYIQSDEELRGECTWFCWGRALEKCGKEIAFYRDTSNHGGKWYENCDANKSGVTKRAAADGPVTNSICSCSGRYGDDSPTSHGHVIFVEQVVGDNVYYTEANVTPPDGVVHICSKSNFPPLERIPHGYLVL